MAKRKKQLTHEEKFPHDGFPFRLEYNDRGDNRTCWFSHDIYLFKHLDRYSITEYNAEHAEGLAIEAPKKKGSRKVTKKPSATKASAKPKAKKKTTKKQVFSTLDTFFES